MKFEDAYKLVGIAEGGYSNHPKDKGGETICGIARNRNPQCAIWKMVDRWKERGNTSPQALTKLAHSDPEFMGIIKGFYRGGYWNACRCDELPNLWRYPVYSCSVNCGSKIAIKLLQKVVGTTADGIYGGKTTGKVRTFPYKEQVFVDKFCDLWCKYYDQIVKHYPEQEVFLNGWKNRVSDVKTDNF